MKIAHISDVHIRNLHYHDDYRKVFDQLYDELDDIDPKYIVVTGDIAHSKTDLSPEYVELSSELFGNIVDLCREELIIIPGNHDLQVNNPSRTDAIQPIIDLFDDDRMNYLKKSGSFKYDDICFHHMSVLEEQEEWDQKISFCEDKVNIGLFHGVVSGAKTDVGWQMEDGEVDKKFLSKFDYVFLGDIHKSNQVMDDDGKVRYPGSLIQQNFGEDKDKGFLLWEIDNSEDFSVDFVNLEHPSPFITVDSDSYKEYDDLDNARVRLDFPHDANKEQIIEVRDYILENNDPESIQSISRIEDNKKENVDIDETKSINDWLEEYLSEKDDDFLAGIKKLNKHIEDENNIVDDELSGVSEWSLQELEWSNYFSFAENNQIDFTDLKGLIGVFGANYSGKSSIIETILFTLFNKTAKNMSRNYNVVNFEKKEAEARLVLSDGSNQYTIERCVERKSDSASTELNFYKDGTKINGKNRYKTDAKIRNHFGTLDNFLVSNVSSQLNSTEYIEKGSSKRKKILSSFLGLKRFQERYKESRELQRELESKIDTLPDLEEINKNIKSLEKELENKKHKSNLIKNDISTINNFIETKKDKLYSLKGKADKLSQRQKIQSEIESICDQYSKLKDKLKQKVKFKYSTQQVEVLKNKQKRKEELRNKKRKLAGEVQRLQDKCNDLREYEDYIDEPPCNENYDDCCLVDKAEKKVSELNKKENELEKKSDKLSEVISNLEEKYDVDFDSKIDDKKQALNSIESARGNIADLKRKHKELNKELTSINKDLDNIENEDQLKEKVRELKNYIEHLNDKLDQKQERRQELTKKVGFKEKELEESKSDKKELSKTKKRLELVDEYRDCMHSDGVPSYIISKALPKINSKVSRITSDIASFETELGIDDGDLEIYIKDQYSDEQRLIEVASGSEKMIAAMAIRLALIETSVKPVPNVFILDEPATELDSEHLSDFAEILRLLKEKFDTVLLVSHIDKLKDYVDKEINVYKNDNNFSEISK